MQPFKGTFELEPPNNTLEVDVLIRVKLTTDFASLHDIQTSIASGMAELASYGTVEYETKVTQVEVVKAPEDVVRTTSVGEEEPVRIPGPMGVRPNYRPTKRKRKR